MSSALETSSHRKRRRAGPKITESRGYTPAPLASSFEKILRAHSEALRCRQAELPGDGPPLESSRRQGQIHQRVAPSGTSGQWGSAETGGTAPPSWRADPCEESARPAREQFHCCPAPHRQMAMFVRRRFLQVRRRRRLPLAAENSTQCAHPESAFPLRTCCRKAVPAQTHRPDPDRLECPMKTPASLACGCLPQDFATLGQSAQSG